MKMSKKYYFSRKEATAVYADNEEEARLQLGQIYEDSESFILDDVMDVVEIDGEFKVVGR